VVLRMQKWKMSKAHFHLALGASLLHSGTSSVRHVEQAEQAVRVDHISRMQIVLRDQVVRHNM
jgi:hypothetical protein